MKDAQELTLRELLGHPDSLVRDQADRLFRTLQMLKANEEEREVRVQATIQIEQALRRRCVTQAS